MLFRQINGFFHARFSERSFMYFTVFIDEWKIVRKIAANFQEQQIIIQKIVENFREEQIITHHELSFKNLHGSEQ